MKKSLWLMLVFILAATIVLTGCSNKYESENNSLKKEVADFKQKNVELEKNINELKDKAKDQERQIEELKQITTQAKDSIYSVYTMDTNTSIKEVDKKIYINSNLSQKEKMEALAKELSTAYFSNLPIEVIKIEEVENKKIAVVNLSESKENMLLTDPYKYSGDAWATKFFQGSTGGERTAVQLVDTFLQKDYSGQWVDGVRFLYNNKKAEFDHVPELSKVNYRK